jgi:hypothetical protein
MLKGIIPMKKTLQKTKGAQPVANFSTRLDANIKTAVVVASAYSDISIQEITVSALALFLGADCEEYRQTQKRITERLRSQKVNLSFNPAHIQQCELPLAA